ncbi:glucosaminidase domain-containing protein [Staphylococcus pseudintermedius]|uniref:glucosaminidase domain-containing protein n=1 Tax=Staphylococcus pseudintermedius TaxID=283734 RepID=UPI00387DC3DF
MDTNKIFNNNVQVYQFLKLNQYQGISVDKLNKLLVGKGTLQNQGQAFADGCKKYGVNEIYLIAHAFLESANGTSFFASGRTGVYNYFGIGAFDNNPTTQWNSHAVMDGHHLLKRLLVVPNLLEKDISM